MSFQGNEFRKLFHQSNKLTNVIMNDSMMWAIREKKIKYTYKRLIVS